MYLYNVFEKDFDRFRHYELKDILENSKYLQMGQNLYFNKILKI